uniref:Uncharacterized protein n=1 Tax=uncultured bacterium Contigcl_30 TaxID=1393670 RepID=W0FL64_9BACT|nr:hypothetical protein [uncultured bacterium Contigcl_30]
MILIGRGLDFIIGKTDEARDFENKEERSENLNRKAVQLSGCENTSGLTEEEKDDRKA